MNTLLYLSFGKGRHQHEVAYSLATLGRFSKRECVGHCGRIVIATDTPEFFNGCPKIVAVAAVESDVVAEWTGHGGHCFRSRIKAMQWVMSQSGGKLLAVDGDTYFTQPPAALFRRIANGRTIMYEPECAFADASIPEYRRTGQVLNDLKRLLVRDGRRTYPCGWRTMQWNAGVLGICAEDVSLLGDVLIVLDTLHPLLPAVWSTEQTAFSVIWGGATQIVPACGHVFHYNAHRDRTSFTQLIPDLLRSCAALPEASRGERLYRYRLRRSPRAATKHLFKRLIVACGMWDDVMMLRRQYWTGNVSHPDIAACSDLCARPIGE
jgi:hypothetical protein